MLFPHRGGKSVADIDTGGPKSLHFDKLTLLSLLFLPRGGPNSIANFDEGAWPDLPPLGSATAHTQGQFAIIRPKCCIKEMFARQSCSICIHSKCGVVYEMTAVD